MNELSTQNADGTEPGVLTEEDSKTPDSFREQLDHAIEQSRDYLLSQQYPEGYWVAELESNVTITAELIFFYHFTGRDEPERVQKLVNYLLARQREDGTWPLYYNGPCDINSTVEAYMALKLAGYPADHPALAKAREAIFANGGLKQCRVFTKIFLAMFGQIPWDQCPAVPVEVVLFPNGFPFNIYEISSWSRGTVVPLSVVCAHQPVHRPEPGRDIRELFTEKDNDLSIQPDGSFFSSWKNFFIGLDRFIKFIGRSPWKPFRKKALKAAEAWIQDHQEEEGDCSGIQPAMMNSLLAYHYLGYPEDHPRVVKGLEAVDRFLIEDGDQISMQACVSPLWDTAIAANALLDSGLPADHPALVKAAEWLLDKQVVKKGDWSVKNPDTEPGGWAFEFYNENYPDCDDTAEILIFLDRVELPNYRRKLQESQRALTWLLSMQSTNGGWAAFDRDNDKEILNEIPFADHKALLDPPTADVTGRVLWLLGRLGFSREHPRVSRALEFIKSQQEPDGCWWGRWGVNYVYGSFLVLNGLRSMSENTNNPEIRKAVKWYEDHQNPDGGWGETCETYKDPSLRGKGASTASQTAWALIGMVASGKENSPAVQRGAQFLIDSQTEGGNWDEPYFTGTGFPVHFYINYHMYRDFFPLMALSRYRNALDKKILRW